MRGLSRRALLSGAGLTVAAASGGLVSLHSRRVTTADADIGETEPLRLAWADAENESMYMLCQRGIFDRFKLNVSRLPLRTAQDAIARLNGPRAADVVIAPVLDWIPAFYGPNAISPPARFVCSVRTGYYRLIVRRDRRINKLADLEGKNVGITRFAGADRRFLSIRLRRKFMPPMEGINWVELPVTDMALAFLEGKIDAFVLHDAQSWRVLQMVGQMGWNMLDSMTGLARNRVDLVLALSDKARERNPALAHRIASCFLAAQAAYKGQLPGLTRQWQTRPGAPPDVAGMLRRQTGGTVLTNHMLQVQIAQYVDEFKLIGLIPGAASSAKIASDLTLTV